jgi:predicted lipoprotein with Yx(FWY)xxD motif
MNNVSARTAGAMALAAAVAGSVLTSVLSSPRAVAQPAAAAPAVDEHALVLVNESRADHPGANFYTFRDGAGRTFLVTYGKDSMAMVQKMPAK